MLFMDESFTDQRSESSTNIRMNVSLEAESNKELITEEDVIDTLFCRCDTESTGLVPVSSLIEYLRYTTCNAVGSENEIEKLSLRLDPIGEDVKIDLTTFRNAISGWIECLRKKNEDVEISYKSSPLKRKRKDTDLNSSSSSLGIMNPSDMASLSFNILDAVEVSDSSEYKNQLAELKFHNKKLNDENSKLQQHLVQQDEQVVNLNMEAENLKKKIKSLQEIADLREDLQRENDDLKIVVSNLQENTKHLKDKIVMLEKESAYLEIQVTDADYKIQKLTTEVETVRTQQQDSIKALRKEKDLNIELRDNKLLLETQLSEKNNEVHELEIYLNDFTKSNNDLKERQSELQSLLTKAQHDVLSLRNDEDGPCNISSLSDFENDDVVMKNGELIPAVCITPARSASICSELKGMLDRHLPSPLCPKELEGTIDNSFDSTDFEVMDFDLEDNSLSPVVDVSKGASSVSQETALVNLKREEPPPAFIGDEDLFLAAINRMTRFKNRHDEMIKDLSSFVADKNLNTQINQFLGEKYVRKLRTRLDRMAKMFSSLAKSKEISDQRSSTLLTTMNKLKDENKKIKEMHEDSVYKLATLESEVNTRLDNRIVSLEDQLNQEKTEKIKLKNEFLLTKEETGRLKSHIASRDVEIQHLSHKKDLLDREIDKYRSSSVSLAEQCHKAELKIIELEEEVSSTLETCRSQNDKCRNLENAVTKSEALQEKLIKEADFLRIELDKKEKVLNALRKRSSVLNTRHVSVKKSDKHSEYSQLFDALNAEFSQLSNSNYSQTRHPHSSLENHSLMIDSLNNFHQSSLSPVQVFYMHAKSCSQLWGKPLITNSSTQTDIHSLQMSLSGSSSSGIHDLDSSSSSFSSMTGRVKKKRCIRKPCLTVANKYKPVNSSQSHVMHQKKTSDNCNVSENISSQPVYKRRWSYMTAIENDVIKQNIFHGNDIEPGSQLAVDKTKERQEDSIADATVLIQKVPLENSETGEGDVFLNNSWSNSVGTNDICRRSDPKVVTSVDSGTCSLNEKILSKDLNAVHLIHSSKGNGEIFKASSSADMLSNIRKEEFREKSHDKYHDRKSMRSPEVQDTVNSRNEELTECHNSVLATGSVSFLRKMRNDNIARRRENVKQKKMPELPEMIEQDTTVKNGSLSDELDTSGEEDRGKSPCDSSSPVCAFPSITDELLQNLGLKNSNQMSSIDQLSDEEIEVKFNSLSLAFKTDNLTLNQRLKIQERSRNVSEENVDKELKALRDALEILDKLIPDYYVREISNKIRGHIDVLANATARVSSRSEMFGAVQQESRLGRAIEIMVNHVENLKRGYEREHAELEDIRKMLPEKNFADGGDILRRRSASVCPGMPNAPRFARRRGSEAALPRFNPSNSDLLGFSESLSKPSKETSLSDDEDMRMRFQNSQKTSIVRRAAVDKLIPSLTVASLTPDSDSKTKEVKKSPSDEEAFQRGFEQGVRTQISRELSELREQQTLLSNSLEEIMDQNEATDDEEERTLKQAVAAKFQQKWLELRSSGLTKNMRMTMAGLVLLMAFCSAVLTFIPVGSTSIEVNPNFNHHGQPPL